MDRSTATLERDDRVALYKDLARTLDYLETRAEFDHDRIAYFGLSWGAWMAPVFGALEKRIKFFLLEGGGLTSTGAPEVNPVNLAPRHTAPTVLINGRFDLLVPLETDSAALARSLPGSGEVAGRLRPIGSRTGSRSLDWGPSGEEVWRVLETVARRAVRML